MNVSLPSFVIMPDSGDSRFFMISIMRPLFQLLAALFMLCFLASCEQETILNIDQTSVTIPDTGGSQSITITANKPWNINSDQSWCKVSPTSGEETNNSQITIICEQNTSYDARFCNIVITCAELKKTVTVAQSENYGLLISPTEYLISDAAQQVNIEVKSNVQFSVTVEDGSKDWIQHSATKGLISNTVVLDITENKSYDSREGRVRISQTDGSLFSTIKIKQAQRDTIHVDNRELTINSKGGLLEMPVASNFDYSVIIEDEAKSWLSVFETKAITSSTITLKVEPNEVEEPREGKVIVQNSDGKVASSFIVKQRAKNTLQASIHDYISSSAGAILGLTISASIDYAVKILDDVSWVTQLSVDSANSDSVFFSISNNMIENYRTANIVFINTEEELSDTLKVEQYPVNVSMSDEILYTSTDGTLVNPYKTDAFNATIVSNTIINGIGSFRFDQSLEVIGQKAFYNRLNLKSMVLPEGVSELQEHAFDNCIWLETITMPSTITGIGDAVFNNCRSIEALSIPSVERIPDDAFQGCIKLKSIILPKSLENIGTGAFSNCSSLISVNIPEGIQLLSPSSFSGCTSLSSITVPEGVEIIMWDCFLGCSNLKEVHLPSSLTSIGSGVFANCSSLKGIILPDGLTELGGGAFQNCSSLETINIPDGISCIHGSTFSSCVSLSSIKLPKQLTKLEMYALDRTGLISIAIPDNVFEIGPCAFEQCKKLESVVLPKSLTTIKYYTFRECSALKTIEIPASVTTIEDAAFSWSGLQTIKLNEGLKVIDHQVFEACESLKEINIPSSVKSIGGLAFGGCSSLTKANIPDGITLISSGLFNYCKSLKSIEIPASVERIEYDAFLECESLTSIVIPAKVTFLGSNVFKGCISLTKATLLPQTPPTCENNGAFEDTNECPIYVPKTSVDSYKKAKNWQRWAHRIQAIP